MHVIAHRWDGAPQLREESVEGRLIVHRVAMDDDVVAHESSVTPHGPEIGAGMLASSFPAQAFAWQAAIVAERLIESERVDIIEAQEWEAPLYYLQLRRALGLGPRRRPPVVVHLHSSTEQIFEANRWDRAVADYAPAATLEEYSITAADALLSPSRFVADQAMARYSIDPTRLSVIPYPLGERALLERSAQTWKGGSISYIGRLETRKGIVEWVDAAVTVALDFPDLRVEFVGGDTAVAVSGGATVGDVARARIPRNVRRQFRFHGVRDRRGMLDVLSRSRAAAVPSRWENFPYSCIEAMASGLPVIASPHGGMRELIADGVSGWIARDSTPAALTATLRQLLDTGPEQLQLMGDAAAKSVERICDNDVIVKRHLELKYRLSVSPLPAIRVASPVAAAAGVVSDRRPSQETVGRRTGIAVVVNGSFNDLTIEECLSSLREQIQQPATVWVVCSAPTPLLVNLCAGERWHLVDVGVNPDEHSVMTTMRLAASSAAILGVALVDSRMRLSRDCLSACTQAFQSANRIGLLSAWVRETAPRRLVRIPPNPGLPYDWPGDRLAPFVVISADTLIDVHQGDVERTADLREYLDGIVRRGWAAVTFPGILGSIHLDHDDVLARASAVEYSPIARAVQRLHTPFLRWLAECPAEERRALLRQSMRNPARSLRWIAARAFRGWSPFVDRTGSTSAVKTGRSRQESRNV